MPKEALSAPRMSAQVAKTIICQDCGIVAPKTGARGGQKYCSACATAKRKERDRLAAEKKRERAGIAKVKGVQFSCMECGKLDVATSGNIQKYCADCAKIVDLRNARKHSSARTSNPSRRDNFNKWFREQAKRPEILLSRRMKRLVSLSLSTSGGKGGRSWKSLVGYSVEELRRHVELQFLPGMNWENRSEWHLDHIVPLSSFKYSTADDDEFRAAWAITNLRPLWGRDNVRKNAKRIFLI